MYFRTYVSDKGYIPRIRKELQTNREKKNERLERTLHKENTQRTNNTVKSNQGNIN